MCKFVRTCENRGVRGDLGANLATFRVNVRNTEVFVCFEGVKPMLFVVLGYCLN